MVPTGPAKMDPSPAAINRMTEVAEKLGAKPSVSVSQPAHAWSNHEVGTLRMGPRGMEAVTNYHGRVHDTENLSVADASVFPCVGVANPMLTITALAYRLAHHIGIKLGFNPDTTEPWSICAGTEDLARTSAG